MGKTYPKVLGHNDVNQAVYYLEEKMANDIAEATAAVLPELPDDDGDYFLAVTITDGEPDYSWQTLADGT